MPENESPENFISIARPLKIRRGAIESLTIHEVSDSELTLLERGSPESLFLTFGTLLLSTAISFTVTLLTTSITSIRTFTVFVVITVIGYLAGVICLALWWRNRQTVADIIKQIRERLPVGDEVQPVQLLPENPS